MQVGEIQDGEEAALAALWERCGLTRPWNDPFADIALALATPMSTVLVGRRAGRIVGSVMAGCDGHRGWVYYLAVDPDLQGTGLGRALMQAAETWVQAKGAPKLQLMVRGANAQALGFYRALGYAIEDVTVLGKRFDGKAWTVKDR